MNTSINKINQLIEPLNLAQTDAVKHRNKHLLVISCPGSGKTRCLTHRLASLIVEGINPSNILCVTFTRKASREMIDRTNRLLESIDENIYLGSMMIGTFHSICLKILRAEGINHGVADADKQRDIIKKILMRSNIDQDFVYDALHRINYEKAFGRGPSAVESKLVRDVFQEYENALNKEKLLDYDDILLRTKQLFDAHPETRYKWQNQFQHILVDELQDTNMVQFSILESLISNNSTFFGVGDFAQSIYGWRGSLPDYINKFSENWKTDIIKLETNYRSGQKILNLAQSLIKASSLPLQASLNGVNGEGIQPVITQHMDEYAEATWIARTIKGLRSRNTPLHEIGILYRTHALSRVLEQVLSKEKVPYKLDHALSFTRRKEIRDILSYLSVIHNKDTEAIKRIINMPSRKIGPVTLNPIMAEALSLDKSLWDMLQLTKAKPIKSFIKLINKISDLPTLTEQFGAIVELTRYKQYLLSFDKETGEERVQNIEQLGVMINQCVTYDKLLEEIATIEDGVKQVGSAIHLLTMHAAKGLEFDAVFILGVEDGIIPHSKSISEGLDRIEEERRLLYVATTRARKNLFLSHTNSRLGFNRKSGTKCSRFITPDVLKHLYKEVI